MKAIPWVTILAAGLFSLLRPVESSALETAVAAEREDAVKANYLITVADDFVVEIYKNGQRVPDAQRTLILERFGATAERVSVAVRAGDWLVFHVVHDRLRWNGSKYFAVAGCFGENEFGF